MSESYFRRLLSGTPTRVWVNNPTPEEVGFALVEGAVGCTTNPAFAGNLLRRSPQVVLATVSDAVDEQPDAPVAAIMDEVQRRLASPLVKAYRPIYDESGGNFGLVSIQGAPNADTDGESIWKSAQTTTRSARMQRPKYQQPFRALWRLTEWSSAVGQ